MNVGGKRSLTKSSRRVVPAKHRRSCRQDLDNTNPLPLTTRDTTDVLVSDLGVVRVRNAHGSQQEIAVLLPVLLWVGEV